MDEPKNKFVVAGIVTSMEYQKCKFYVQKLVKTFPKEFDPPVLRPMLNVAWKEYLWKIRRNIGGKVWTLEKNAVVFLNNAFLGDDVAIFNYLTNRARLRVAEDFHCLGILELRDIFNRVAENKRKLAYISIAVEGKCIGSLLFLLYADHVPRTVKHFLRRCKSQKRGWLGRPIHRLVKGSWLQLGGFDLENRKMPCENYIVPHDRRGVLSTCHNGKHTDNTVQLVLSLAPTPWMDYKFVAFGQMIQGDEVLKRIEAIETNYEAPLKPITVWKCGEYILDTPPDPLTTFQIKTYLESVNPYTGLTDDVLDPRDVPSELSVRNYKKGLYCLETDLEPHPALNKWYIYYETAYGQPPAPKVQVEGEGISYSVTDLIDIPVVVSEAISDILDAVDKEVGDSIPQLLSKENIHFQPDKRPSKTMSFEKRQKLDLEHIPPEVADAIEALMQLELPEDSQPPSKTEDSIRHIVE